MTGKEKQMLVRIAEFIGENSYDNIRSYVDCVLICDTTPPKNVLKFIAERFHHFLIHEGKLPLDEAFKSNEGKRVSTALRKSKRKIIIYSATRDMWCDIERAKANKAKLTVEEAAKATRKKYRLSIDTPALCRAYYKSKPLFDPHKKEFRMNGFIFPEYGGWKLLKN